VGLNPTRTGLLDALAAMGADLQVAPGGEQCGEPFGRVTARFGPLHATRVNGSLVVRMIDEFPIFAVAAACAHGRTVVENAEELRYKESDRIAMLCCELRAIGIDARETVDGFVIQGGQAPAGGQVDAHGDHRLAMSMLVAGLAARGPVLVPGAEIISESFPGFADALRTLGAEIEEGRE